MIDGHFGSSPPDFLAQAIDEARSLARENFEEQIAAKRRTREADEARKPLSAYRAEELERMKLNFFGFDSSYHVARHNFVRKVPKARTPSYLARHRVPQRKGCATFGSEQTPASRLAPQDQTVAGDWRTTGVTSTETVSDASHTWPSWIVQASFIERATSVCNASVS